MAAIATVSLGGAVSGLPTGVKTLSATWTSSAAVGTVTDTTLASGDNTIAVPAGTTLVLIQPPAGNAVALKIKGAAGDTGILIHLTLATVLALASGQASIVVNAASATSGATEFSFV